MTTHTTILKDVALVLLSISIWSGAKKLEPRDFINVDVDDLPSSRVATYGTKHLINKDRLQPFKTLRGKAERLCGKYGTRLMGGYAIPQDCIDLVSQELRSICDEFEGEIITFISEYDEAINDWIKDNPGFEEPLRRAVLPQAIVRSRFRASFSVFEVSASPRDRTNSLAGVGTDLLDSLLGSVVTTLKPLVERKVGVADSFRVEVRQSISDLASKFRRFSFMDPDGGMLKLADQLESHVAGSGKIRDVEFKRLWSLLTTLNSVSAIKKAIADLTGPVASQPPLKPAADATVQAISSTTAILPGFDPVELDDAFAAFNTTTDSEERKKQDAQLHPASDQPISAEKFVNMEFPILDDTSTVKSGPSTQKASIDSETSQWVPNFAW